MKGKNRMQHYQKPILLRMTLRHQQQAETWIQMKITNVARIEQCYLISWGITMDSRMKFSFSS